MLPHAPGVQMADIPEDSVNLDKEVGKPFLTSGLYGIRIKIMGNITHTGRGGGRC